jgi:hypothetical protein
MKLSLSHDIGASLSFYQQLHDKDEFWTGMGQIPGSKEINFEAKAATGRARGVSAAQVLAVRVREARWTCWGPRLLSKNGLASPSRFFFPSC